MDTDVIVAAVRSSKGASREWFQAVLSQKVELALSVPLILQYEDVLLRKEHLTASRMSKTDVGILLDSLSLICKRVRISFLWRPTLKDPDDEMVLETAVNGRVDCLLTFNEKDFLKAKKFNLQLLKPGIAWKKWKGEVL